MSAIDQTTLPALQPIPSEELAEWYYDALHAALNSMRRVFMRLRSEEGISQEVVAHRSGMKKAAVSRVFRGRTNPTVRTLNAIARAMNCRLEINFKPLKDLHKPNHCFEDEQEYRPASTTANLGSVIIHAR